MTKFYAFLEGLKNPDNTHIINLLECAYLKTISDSALDEMIEVYIDIIPGGDDGKTDPRTIDRNELKLGVSEELEHTINPRIAFEIAVDHLAEDGSYYSKSTEVMTESIVYPAGFNIKELDSLTSQAARKRYVDEYLEKIGAGSARIVYRIDDEHVLKLAKNKKGVAQNNVERDGYLQQRFPEIIASVVDSHPDNMWIIAEKAKKINKSRFKSITGFRFEDFAETLRNRIREVRGGRRWLDDPDGMDELYDDDFFNELVDMAVAMDLEEGDLARISSYGELDDDPVVVDTGLSKEVYRSLYESGDLSQRQKNIYGILSLYKGYRKLENAKALAKYASGGSEEPLREVLLQQLSDDELQSIIEKGRRLRKNDRSDEDKAKEEKRKAREDRKNEQGYAAMEREKKKMEKESSNEIKRLQAMGILDVDGNYIPEDEREY
jgi:hypothetical protein